MPFNGPIYIIWPADKHGRPGGSWRQDKRWLVLDVTDGLDAFEVVAGPMTRGEALDESLRLRRRRDKDEG
jgi:hypothetical protein